jgi:choline dehydrogenase-like flavoprotein
MEEMSFDYIVIGAGSAGCATPTEPPPIRRR